MDLGLKDKVAVVTGASSGIGYAFTEHLARAGLNLVLASRSADRLHAIGRDLATRHGIDHRAVGVDLSSPDGPQVLIAVRIAGVDARGLDGHGDG